MPLPAILAGLFLLLVIIAGVGGLLLVQAARASRMAMRLKLVTGDDSSLVGPVKAGGSPVLRGVAAFGMVIARSGLLSRKTLTEMTATLEAAGLKGGRGLGLFIGAKILLMVLLPTVLFFGLRHIGASTFWSLVKIGGGAGVGMLAPEMIANKMRGNYLKKVEVAVPDALDMLVICADAGLALEAGLSRVSQEMDTLSPELATELTQTSRELQIGADMRRAMEALGERTGLDTLKRLAATLAQSMQFGTPLTQALRTLSAELRQEALVAFEEKAGRLPTLMTVPMILFILPCIFLIVAGPAILNVMATKHGMK